MVEYLAEPLEEYLGHSDDDEEEYIGEGLENDEDIEPKIVFTDTQKLIAGIAIGVPLLLGMFWLLGSFRRD